MSNILMIRTTSGKYLTHQRADDNYTDANEIAAKCIEIHYPGEKMDTFAICGALALHEAVEEGKKFVPGMTSGAGDFSIKTKRQITTQTIIPPFGVGISAISSDENVVCYL